MQSPVDEITSVVKGLIEAPTADAQRAVLTRYFSPDASFDHPLCAVASTSGSRDAGVLPVYQWLRMMFTPTIKVTSVALDSQHNRLYVDAAQTLQPNLPPLSWVYAPTCRLVVLLDLHRGGDGLFYVHRQQDFYEPQVMPGQLVPGGWTIINLIKLCAGFGCAIMAMLAMFITGYWKTTAVKVPAGKVINGKKST